MMGIKDGDMMFHPSMKGPGLHPTPEAPRVKNLHETKPVWTLTTGVPKGGFVPKGLFALLSYPNPTP